MTPDDAVHAMADRLSAVNWERHGHRCWSKAALLKEYFRRAARWADAYRCDTPVPFFDIAACADPTVRADQRVIDELLAKVDGGWDVDHTIPYVLHWAALGGSGFALPAGLDDPFEPMVLLFERDGGFHTENGEVDLEYLSVSMRRWRARADDPPMAGFGTGALDEIDRTGSLAQFGHIMGPDGN